jgi:hypothetical protein
VGLALAACGDSHGMAAGSETNWLRACTSDRDCGAGECVCGVCSADCAEDDDCPGGLVCKHDDSMLYEQTCGIDLEVDGLCAPECERDPDCGDGRICSDGACALAPASNPESDAGAAMNTLPPDDEPDPPGERQLIIDSHLRLSPECTPDLDLPIGSGEGMFDISPGGRDGESEQCNTPYRLVLRVQNLASERVLVTGVQVVLRSIQDQRIDFNRTDPSLPNPFALSVTGSIPPATDGATGIDVIVAEAIPTGYALQLDGFIGGQIAIRVQLSGETVSGAPVHSNVFEYRVGICYGCLTQCVNEIPTGIAIDDLIGDACFDNAGADGRLCFDPGC